MTDSKHCADSRQANRQYLKLCDRWESVQLVRAPLFTEAGLYVWSIAGRIH